MEQKKRSNALITAIVIAVILALMVYAAVSTRGVTRLQDCPECEGAGVVTVANYDTGAEEERGGGTCGSAGTVAAPSHVYSTFWALTPPSSAVCCIPTLTSSAHSSTSLPTA